MKFPRIGTIAGVGLLGAIAYTVYKFAKGDWSLPSFPDLLGGVFNPPGDPGITIQETGVPGAVGDIIYNVLFQDPEGSLRQRAEEGIPAAQAETEDILKATTLPGEPIPPADPAGVFARSVARETAQDIVDVGPASFLIPGLNIFTIGAGLGAMTQQERWRSTLPRQAQEEALRRESATRLKRVTTDPGTMLATALSIPFITGPLLLQDLLRVAQPPPKRPPPGADIPRARTVIDVPAPPTKTLQDFIPFKL